MISANSLEYSSPAAKIRKHVHGFFSRIFARISQKSLLEFLVEFPLADIRVKIRVKIRIWNKGVRNNGHVHVP